MSHDVSNYIQITIPLALSVAAAKDDGSNPNLHKLSLELDATTKIAGGVTVTEAFGHWFNEAGDVVNEAVQVFRWNFPHSRLAAVRDAAFHVTAAMHLCGEDAVLRERYYSDEAPLGYKAQIIFK